MPNDAFVALARHAIESYVENGQKAALPKNLPDALLKEKAGVFVSLHKHGQLRGCIGTTAPTQGCIAEEILQNAGWAACEDPRFSPVLPEELDMLCIQYKVVFDTIPQDNIVEILD